MIAPQNKEIAKILQGTLNIILIALALLLILFLLKETYFLATLLFEYSDKDPPYPILEGVVIYFLYFEFIALIAKYFHSGYHFPLRYFIYIGITAVIRFIIVDHNNPQGALLYSGAILLLIIALYLAHLRQMKVGRGG